MTNLMSVRVYSSDRHCHRRYRLSQKLFLQPQGSMLAFSQLSAAVGPKPEIEIEGQLPARSEPLPLNSTHHDRSATLSLSCLRGSEDAIPQLRLICKPQHSARPENLASYLSQRPASAGAAMFQKLSSARNLLRSPRMTKVQYDLQAPGARG